MADAALPTVLIVPGLRDHVAEHWQTLLAAQLPRVRTVPPMGREDLDCAAKVAAIEREAQAVDGPLIVVAHSGGVVMLAHWARQTHAGRGRRAAGDAARFRAGRCRPAIRHWTRCAPAAGCRCRASRCRSAASWRPAATTRWDASSASRELARDWGSGLVDLGEVGHLNPASGYGPWPRALDLHRRTGHSG